MNFHTAKLTIVIANLAVPPNHRVRMYFGRPQCPNLLVVWSANIWISTVNVHVILGLESCNSSCSMHSPYVYHMYSLRLAPTMFYIHLVLCIMVYRLQMWGFLVQVCHLKIYISDTPYLVLVRVTLKLTTVISSPF